MLSWGDVWRAQKGNWQERHEEGGIGRPPSVLDADGQRSKGADSQDGCRQDGPSFQKVIQLHLLPRDCT